MSFAGFPVAAMDFYDDLELDNTKSFWEANKHIYQDAVRAPMLALIADLSDEFSSPGGKTTVFRPYRDVRFRADKTPYKTHQGAFVKIAPATGWYVEISARGTRIGAGSYEIPSDRLARIRRAIDDEVIGARLETILTDLDADGFEVGGDKLKTSPRGYAADHPRIELLRHKQFLVSKSYGFEADAIGPDLPDRIRADWLRARPLVDWLARQ